METTAALPSKSLLPQILRYENDAVVSKLVNEVGLSPTKAKEVFEDTKKFLYLATLGTKGLRPTKIIDEGWHAFVLHTKDYADFCRHYLEQFIHHQPDGPTTKTSEKVSGFDLTIALAKSTYGDSLSENWVGLMGDCKSELSDCSPDSNCESAPADCALN